MPQEIMKDGPGLKQRARETIAVMNTVDPEDPGVMKAPPATPPQEVDKIHPKAKYGSNKGEVRLPVDQWMKPLSSYKDGTDYVPKTGPAMLHKGEKVTPAKENPMKEMFDKVPGRKSDEKPPKKEIKRIEVTKSHNGKHIVKHVHHHPFHEDETHVMSGMDEMHDHMENHMGTPNDGESADTGAGAPAQMTASPSPMPPAGPAPAAPAMG